MFLVLISLQVLSCSDNDMVEPAPEPTPEPPVEEVPDVKNLALGGVATASSFDSGRAPFYLIDGKIEAAENQGYYSSVGSTENHTEWVQIELTKESEINSIWVYPRYDGIHAGFPVDFTLQTSVDGKQWNIVATGENHTEVTDALPRKYTFADVNAKFVRLVATNLYSANNEWTGYKDTYILQLAEIEVYKRVQSVSSVRLGSYFSVVGEQVEVSVDVETEQVKDNAGVTIELVAAEDGHSSETPVKQTGKLTDNKAAFVLKLSSTLSEGEYKVKAGRKVYDRQREKDKLADVASKVQGEFNKKGIKELYSQLMSMSRKLQYQRLVEAGALGRLPFIQIHSLDKENARVVFQGTEGAYGQAAMNQFFGEDVNCFHVRTFRDAMEAIEEGSADFAVLPIENSSAGPVNEMYDLLDEFENYIVAETILPVVHTLSGLPGTRLSEIKRVYSKAEALMQTTRFLDDHSDWQRISVVNTAIAAKKVLEDQDKAQAAVCSAYAAKIHGLEVLVDDINDEADNSTRFIVVTNQKIFLKDASKISIEFELPHESGSLYNILSHFIYNDLNMTKIESRPVEGKQWEYRFFVDFDGNLEDAAVKNAIRGLREEARNLRILGNYSIDGQI